MLDIVVPNLSATSVSVRRGLGDGTFAPRQDIALGGSPNNPVVADFNGDGRDDLAIPVSMTGNHGVRVFYGQPDGTLGGMVVLPTAESPRVARAGDLNGDGLPDIVVAQAGNTGTVVLSVYLNNPAGGFMPLQTVFNHQSAESLALGDVNGDGVLDMLVTTSGAPFVHLHLGIGNGTFDPYVLTVSLLTQTRHIDLVDLNNDGKLDIVANNDNSFTFMVALGNGDATFQPVTFVEMPTQGAARRRGLADINGDGKIDLVFGHRNTGLVSVWLGVGDGTFAPPSTFSVPGGPSAVALADLDNDGDLDLIVASETSNELRVFLNQCLLRPSITAQPQSLAVKRKTGAQLQVQVAGGTPPVTVQWYFGNAPLSDGGPVSGAHTPTLTIDPADFEHVGQYYAVASGPGGSATSAMAILAVSNSCPGDFNGDGILDIFDIISFLGQFSAGCPEGAPGG
ncbi:MAG: VCBS repeat-containing protein [Phycisphaeraceae bacterium]|nr:VCBS repeat-containing protein [Phycisphaeraceae bacterium]